MNLITIWLIQSDNRADDKIEVSRGSRASEMIEVTYTPADSTSQASYKFFLSRSGLRRYLGNLFYALTRDHDPFEKVQISLTTSPSIIFHVSDLEESEDTIMSMIDDILYTDVTRV
jgi:hypothetical protein